MFDSFRCSSMAMTWRSSTSTSPQVVCRRITAELCPKSTTQEKTGIHASRSTISSSSTGPPSDSNKRAEAPPSQNFSTNFSFIFSSARYDWPQLESGNVCNEKAKTFRFALDISAKFHPRQEDPNFRFMCFFGVRLMRHSKNKSSQTKTKRRTSFQRKTFSLQALEEEKSESSKFIKMKNDFSDNANFFFSTAHSA